MIKEAVFFLFHVGWGFKKSVDIYKSFFKWIPVIRCENRNRRMNGTSPLYIFEEYLCVFYRPFSLMMTYE